MSKFAPGRLDSITHLVRSLRGLWRKRPRRNERLALTKVRLAGALLVENASKLRRLDPDLASSLQLLGQALVTSSVAPTDEAQQLQENLDAQS